MIEALSSKVRSVNSGTICGVETRTSRKAKNPASISATAAMAAKRAAPSDLTKAKNPCTRNLPRFFPLGNQAQGVRPTRQNLPSYG
jgi:hypothetical protein